MGTRRTVAELDDKPEAPAKAAPAEKADDGKHTPDEWAAIAFPPVPRPGHPTMTRPNPDLWQHNCAAALHGWKAHAHHEQAPGKELRFDRAAYDGALKAAQTPVKGENETQTKKNRKAKPVKRHGYVPHKAACSIHAPYMREKR